MKDRRMYYRLREVMAVQNSNSYGQLMVIGGKRGL